ncbi:MAG: hypothetical protein M3384_14175 [Acidobacteriota bacterium]|nr:hypothetical protein [Acidobacteriota bacterium]
MTFRLRMPERRDMIRLPSGYHYVTLCFGIVSDDPDKTRRIGSSQNGGLYFSTLSASLQSLSGKPEKDEKRPPAKAA